jgi:hypothetical protein
LEQRRRLPAGEVLAEFDAIAFGEEEEEEGIFFANFIKPKLDRPLEKSISI